MYPAGWNKDLLVLHAIRFTLLLLPATLIAAGCGGGGTPEIKDVSSCLKELGLMVEQPKTNDKDVEEGVFATTDISKGDVKNLTIALAATAKTDAAVKEFEKESKDFAKQDFGGESKLTVDSGTSGRYVWVVAGAKGSDGFKDARDCVQP